MQRVPVGGLKEVTVSERRYECHSYIYYTHTRAHANGVFTRLMPKREIGMERAMTQLEK